MAQFHLLEQVYEETHRGHLIEEGQVLIYVLFIFLQL
jgi:hypothetical protein